MYHNRKQRNKFWVAGAVVLLLLAAMFFFKWPPFLFSPEGKEKSVSTTTADSLQKTTSVPTAEKSAGSELFKEQNPMSGNAANEPPAPVQPVSSQPTQQAKDENPKLACDGEEYTVKKGDTVSRILVSKGFAPSKINLEKVRQASGLDDAYHIYPTNKLCLPKGLQGIKKAERKVKAKVVKPAPAKKVTLAIAKPPKAKAKCVTLNRAPWNKSLSLDLRIEGIKINPRLTQSQKDEAIGLILQGKGEKRLITSDMTWEAMPFRSKSGKAKFLYDVKVCTPEEGGKPEVAEFWRLADGTWIGDPLSCGNIGPVRMPEEKKPEEPEPKKLEPKKLEPKVPVKPRPAPAISVFPEEQEIAEWEVIAGAGLWRNELARGKWKFAEGIVSATMSDGYGLGAGIYYSEGSGKSKAGFRWKEGGDWKSGWGPQVAIKRNFLKTHKDEFDQTVLLPATWQVKLRYIPNDRSRGHSTVSDFEQKQRGKKIGLRGEYTERTSLDWLFGGYVELWHSFDRSITSNFAGVRPQDRGSLAVGAFAQYRVDNDWQIRGTAELNRQKWDKLNLLNLYAEARYDETLMAGVRCGFALNHPDAYRDASRSDLTTCGPFVRAEFGGKIRVAGEQAREESVVKIGSAAEVEPMEAGAQASAPEGKPRDHVDDLWATHQLG